MKVWEGGGGREEGGYVNVWEEGIDLLFFSPQLLALGVSQFGTL